MTDLHIHAPQFAFRGLGMDMELLEWLNTYTFPEESKYKELDYADRAYGSFVMLRLKQRFPFITNVFTILCSFAKNASYAADRFN